MHEQSTNLDRHITLATIATGRKNNQASQQQSQIESRILSARRVRTDNAVFARRVDIDNAVVARRVRTIYSSI